MQQMEHTDTLTSITAVVRAAQPRIAAANFGMASARLPSSHSCQPATALAMDVLHTEWEGAQEPECIQIPAAARLEPHKFTCCGVAALATSRGPLREGASRRTQPSSAHHTW